MVNRFTLTERDPGITIKYYLPTFILLHVRNFFTFLQERKQEEKKKGEKKVERLRRKQQELREEKEVRIAVFTLETDNPSRCESGTMFNLDGKFV